MATKKVSAKKVVAEQPVKTAKTAAPATTSIAVAVKATKAAAAPKAVKTPAASKAEKAVATPVAKKAVATTKPASAPTKKAVVPTAKVTFSLPKEAVENAETVAVLGDFNNWQEGVILKKQKDGSFTTAIELEKGRSYEYRFLINGEQWENSWNAEAYKPTPFGAYNSVVTA